MINKKFPNFNRMKISNIHRIVGGDNKNSKGSGVAVGKVFMQIKLLTYRRSVIRVMSQMVD